MVKANRRSDDIPVSPPASSKVVEPYLPTPKEQRALDSHQERQKQAKPLPRQKITMKDGVPNLSDAHADPVIGASVTMEALGMSRVGELTAVLQDVVNLTQKDGKPDEHRVNEMLAQIAAVEPRDSVEAMLATQMTAIHHATLKAARQLRGCETIPQQDGNSNSLNKLARTFASQVEALKRYRSKGEQKMTVEHVTVNEGGQAIVGPVSTGRGGAMKGDINPMHSTPRCTAHSKRTGLPCKAPAASGWSSVPDARSGR